MQTEMDLGGEATRAAGLARLEAFTPRMGRRYAAERNFDRGPGQHRGVSGLSPYLRRRLITEEEAVAAGVHAHGLSGAEKFVQEVFWRSYFKGWLERRPEIWADFAGGVADDRALLGRDRALAREVEAAEAGETEFDCTNAWAAELVETGYLHNHARMWFASIWVFTLGLPWRLGADFFLRHLLDGDPASNTLGWRWVAGLHTRGKTYRARASNIAKYTEGRFRPAGYDLASEAPALDEEPPPPARPIRVPSPVDPSRPTALLITEDECTPEQLGRLPGPVAVATLEGSALRSDRPVAPRVARFEAEALADAAARVAPGAAVTALVAEDPRLLADWAQAAGARQIVTGYVPVGPLRDWLDRAEPALADAGIRLAEIRRPWDEAVWPHATAGFFKVKKQIPAILDRLQPRADGRSVSATSDVV